MEASDPHDVTGWLQAWTEGDPSALAHIVPIVHVRTCLNSAECGAVASRRERSGAKPSG
jgi:hypothetical protein